MDYFLIWIGLKLRQAEKGDQIERDLEREKDIAQDQGLEVLIDVLDVQERIILDTEEQSFEFVSQICPLESDGESSKTFFDVEVKYVTQMFATAKGKRRF